MMEIRPAFGHRFASDEDGDDYCVGCGWNGMGLMRECRPDVPRCGQKDCPNPADVSETINGELLYWCGTHRSDMRVPRVYRCPWCSTPVHDSQAFTDLKGHRWHDGCLSDWAKIAQETAAEG